MATVDVLTVGYFRDEEPDEHLQPTISLVRDTDLIMVVDPGMMNDSNDLIDALARYDLRLGEITHVFLTNLQVDHTRNVGIFPNAIVVDGTSTYRGDIPDWHEGDGYQISDKIKVIQTPGYTNECASLVVSTPDGVVVLTHVWWFSDRTPVHDATASDQARLDRSRATVLELADIVIPGHGAPFRV